MKVEKIHDTQEAFSALRVSLDGYEEYFKERIEEGNAELWRVNDGKSYGITAIEYDKTKDNLVFLICCYEGEDIKSFAKYMIELARDAGCQEIKCHSRRKGFLKLAQQLNWELEEMIFSYGIKKQK